MQTSAPSPKVLIHYPIVAWFEQMSVSCNAQPEVGGILIGHIRGPHLEITLFTTPGPADQSSPYSFTRQDPKHAAEANRHWSGSGQTATFLGEWHTHPHGAPVPSSIDTSSWRRLVKRSKHPMAFVVIAPNAWSVHHVTTRFFRASVCRLERIEAGDDGLVFG